MIYDNEATQIRRELLARLARLFFEGRLREDLHLVPYQMRPRGHGATRCCLYKDRAMLRFRLLAMLGFRVEEVPDEPIPFADLVDQALAREQAAGPPLTIIEDACFSCVQVNYFVTDACRGCLARPCIHVCAKEAMEVHGGRAVIDHKKCINCGRCQEVCPYHAIVFIPIPCMEACPVGAIYAEENGKKNIDWDQCIFCGRCMKACPFGAIMERYEFIDVLQKIAAGKQVSALLAPAMAGQFNAEIERIGAACVAAGFTEAVEVARGADETARREAAEFKERMARGDHLMTTSCCPAYLEAAKKHVPEILPFISATRTPMHYAAKMAKDRNPEAVTVFIGPCVAKRAEAYGDPLVDHVWTFEELAAVFEVKGIDVKTIEPLAFAEPGSPRGRGFPLTGGVAAAVQAARGDGVEIKIERVESLDHKSVRLLKSFAEKCPGNLVEVMACPEGCVAGPAVIENPKTAAARVNKLVRRGE